MQTQQRKSKCVIQKPTKYLSLKKQKNKQKNSANVHPLIANTHKKLLTEESADSGTAVHVTNGKLSFAEFVEGIH